MKPGYKQTEAGLIPEEWHMVAVADLVGPTSPICYGVVQVGQDTENGVPIVAIKFVKEIAHAPLHRTAINLEKPYARSRPRGGDVLISIKGTIGRVGIVPNGFQGNISRELARLRINEHTCSEYIAHQLESGATQERIMRSVVGTTRLEFSIATLRQFQLPIPPTKEEQRAIAQALSDVDALLRALDRLIAKKRYLKQAAMQQLLTGQTRLSGFHGEWEVKRLGDVADVFKGSGLSKAAISLSGTRKCILYGELFTTYGRVIRDVLSRTDAIDGKLAQIGDILMPGSTTTVGIDLAIASALLTEGVFLGGDINIIRKKGAQRYDPEFLANYLTHVKKFEIADKTQGITIIHLYGRTMLDLSISLPTMPEQAAIAEVLSEMDAELLRLEQLRDKTRALKQGMMQELLTGKTRLIASVSAHA